VGAITSETDSKELTTLSELTVAVAVLQETYEQFIGVSTENGWEEDEGARIVFTRGLASLRTRHDTPSPSTADQRQSAFMARTHELDRYMSMYAVIKYKAWKLIQVAQVLEFNLAGTRAELDICRSALRRLQEQ
jgi:hypothetical protein